MSFGRSGFYIGVGASRTVDYLEHYLKDQPVLSAIQVDNSWGVNARAGYRVTSWFAVEGEYEWLDDFSAHISTVEIARIKPQAATANIRLIAPLATGIGYLTFQAGLGYRF